MRLHVFLLLVLPTAVFAWGPDGHRIIGVNALPLLDGTARAKVVEILGNDSDGAVGKACFWPDTVRETPQWEWSAPMHYVNIPRNARHYERQRDCADGLCVTEAIIKYAGVLGRPAVGQEERWQALAWLCHLVGDLHQPLHVGFRDDRGGNYRNVVYRGRSYNLHQFWDSVAASDRPGSRDGGIRLTPDSAPIEAQVEWNPAEVVFWTNESHALVLSSAYPPARVIDESFADQSRMVIIQQWQRASKRLARILNATVGEGTVQIGE